MVPGTVEETGGGDGQILGEQPRSHKTTHYLRQEEE